MAGGDKKLFHPRLADYASCVDSTAIPFQFHAVGGLAHPAPLLAAGDQYAVIPRRRDPGCEHAMTAPASDAIFSARPSIGSACRALRVDARISQLRVARQATGSGPTGAPLGGSACPTESWADDTV